MKLLQFGQWFTLALVMSVSQSFGQSEVFNTPFTIGPDTGTGASGTISFASFNESLGTLTQVDLSLVSVTVSGTVTVTNTNPNGGSNEVFHNVTLDGDYTVTDSANQTVNVDPATSPVNSGTIAPQGTFVAPTPTGGTSPAAATVNTDLLLGTNNLGIYETAGNGTITVNLTSASFYSLGVSGGNASETLNSNGAGTLEVTYIYTVPEPSQTAAWMLGFGLVLLIGRSFLKKFEFGSLARQT
jgi:hypothetical protein